MTTFAARTQRVPLYQSDDLSRLGELQQAVAIAANRPKGAPQRVGAPEMSYADAMAAYEAFVAEAEPRALIVEVKYLGFKKWRSLIGEHPARIDDDGKIREEDEAIGANEETFPEALVRACLVEPEFTTPADRDEFIDSLSDAYLTRIFQAAYAINKFAVVDPKAWLAFAPTPLSDD